MKKLSLAAASLVFAHGAAMASDYQSEISVGYVDVDADGMSDSAVGVSGTFNFAPVSTQGMPLAETGFLNNASNVMLSYSTTDETDIDILSGVIEFYAENLYLAGMYSNTDFGIADESDFGFRVGFAPSNKTLFFVGYEEEENAFGGDDDSILSVGAKHVAPLNADSAFAVEGLLSMLDDDDNTMVLDASADYFFNRFFSAGIRFQESDADNFDTGFGMGARVFFTPTFSVGLEYDSQDDVDTFAILAGMRF